MAEKKSTAAAKKAPAKGKKPETKTKPVKKSLKEKFWERMGKNA